MRLERNELQAFQAVIESGGFNKAAEALSISQSAISQAVANLENKLDTRLLTRGKRIQLTTAGMRIFDYAREVAHGEESALIAVENIKRANQPALSLAVNSMVNAFYMPDLLHRFCQGNPDISVNVREMPSRSMIYTVLSGECELGFGPFQKHMQAYETLPVFTEHRCLVVSDNHPHCEALLAGDINALQQSALLASYLDETRQRPSASRIRDDFASVWQVSSLSLRLELIERGLGVTFVSNRLLAQHPACQSFRQITGLPYSQIVREVGIYYRRGQVLSGSAKNFIAICENTDFGGD